MLLKIKRILCIGVTFFLFIAYSILAIPLFHLNELSAATITSEGFSFTVPDGWVRKEGALGTDFIFTKEIYSDIMPAIIIATDDRQQDFMLKDYVQRTKKKLGEQFPGIKFLFERYVYAGGLRWHELIYQYSYAGYPFQVIQYHTVNKGKYYVITGHSLQSDFGKLLKDFKDTFNSWKLVAEYRN